MNEFTPSIPWYVDTFEEKELVDIDVVQQNIVMRLCRVNMKQTRTILIGIKAFIIVLNAVQFAMRM